MKKILIALAMPVLAGCLSSSVPSVTAWPLEFTRFTAPASKARHGVVRMAQVVVRSPYNSASVCVRRADGSLAFDPYNEFASQPAQLLKGAVQDALEKSQLFADTVGASSTAGAQISAEVTVDSLCLDCTVGEGRFADVTLTLRLLNGREIISSTKGAGRADAADGNYGAAFSKALSAALEQAIVGTM